MFIFISDSETQTHTYQTDGKQGMKVLPFKWLVQRREGFNRKLQSFTSEGGSVETLKTTKCFNNAITDGGVAPLTMLLSNVHSYTVLQILSL